ncbi:MAG: hypothetical protein ACI3YH_03990 [Eubacteriales bacterium]
MSEINSILTALAEAEEYCLKTKYGEYVNHTLDGKRISGSDREAIMNFIFAEFGELLRQLPTAPDYQSKDAMMSYENELMGLLMKCCPDGRNLPPEQMTLVRSLWEMVEEIRFFENAVDKLFAQETVYPAFVEQLLNTHKQLNDEYHRGQLYQGMLHYKKEVAALSDQCKAIFGDYIAAEAVRYLSGTTTGQMLNNLELMVDIAKLVPTDALIGQVYAALQLEKNAIRFFAVETLVVQGKEIPADVVEVLAHDLTYAALTYGVLKGHGKASAFPPALANEEYLAKSDLVHWLTYPSELGKKPDEIEYLGKVESKNENYWIFRYKSDSDNLSDELQNKWLIGWSGDEGGTFSQFDEYALYEKKTPEKTLKYIKKKLIG